MADSFQFQMATSILGAVGIACTTGTALAFIPGLLGCMFLWAALWNGPRDNYDSRGV